MLSDRQSQLRSPSVALMEQQPSCLFVGVLLFFIISSCYLVVPSCAFFELYLILVIMLPGGS
jgi:hypothetical protein